MLDVAQNRIESLISIFAGIKEIIGCNIDNCPSSMMLGSNGETVPNNINYKYWHDYLQAQLVRNWRVSVIIEILQGKKSKKDFGEKHYKIINEHAKKELYEYNKRH